MYNEIEPSLRAKQRMDKQIQCKHTLELNYVQKIGPPLWITKCLVYSVFGWTNVLIRNHLKSEPTSEPRLSVWFVAQIELICHQPTLHSLTASVHSTDGPIPQKFVGRRGSNYDGRTSSGCSGAAIQTDC